jgi:hypothetical protein
VCFLGIRYDGPPAEVFSFVLANFALAFPQPGNFSKGHNFMSAPAQAQPAAPPALTQVLQLSLGFMVSAALSAVTSLEIPDLLQSGPKNVADLAVSTNSNQDALYRVMRALGTVGIFAETAPRTFSLTPLSELLCKNHPQTLRPMVLWMTSGMHFEIFRELGHSVRTGETLPEKVYGLPCFDYLGQNQEVGGLFNDAMTGFSNNAIGATLEAYDLHWLCGKTLVDVAGGHGMVLTEILKKCPEARGVLFDLEHVVKGATSLIHSQGVADRCCTAHGDFFQAVPAGDAYIMKHIIHDWNDERAATILRNIHAAAGPDARLLLLECVLTPGCDPQFAKWLDLEMLALPGGRERTEEEYRDLLGKSGFRMTRVIPTKSPVSVIESVRVN